MKTSMHSLSSHLAVDFFKKSLSHISTFSPSLPIFRYFNFIHKNRPEKKRNQNRERPEIQILLIIIIIIIIYNTKVMDGYGVSSGPAPDNYFLIDDLLDFSDADSLLSSSADNHHLPPPPPSSSQHFPSLPNYSLPSDFTDHLLLPSDDVAELEWLSQFVEDSFTDSPSNSSLYNTGPTVLDTSSRIASSRSSRTKPSAWTSPAVMTGGGKPRYRRETARAVAAAAEEDGGVRRCTHCASEKTPQWRTGPLGPKTLCNACGVRFKSGRLVPEYRPAASPTFVLTQHSNSHRKVLELRRQKEMSRQHQQQNFGVC